jgi:flagellar protein FliL
MSGQNESTEATSPAKSRVMPMLLVAAGLLAGVGGGATAAVLLTRSPAADVHGAEAPEGGHDMASSRAQADAADAYTYMVEDLVVNPAGSGGTRFLIATVGIGLTDAAFAQSLAARDAEVRDAVLGVLGTMTVEQLVAAQADGGARDSLRAAVREPLARMFSEQMVRRVLLPRLVVQ